MARLGRAQQFKPIIQGLNGIFYQSPTITLPSVSATAQANAGGTTTSTPSTINILASAVVATAAFGIGSVNNDILFNGIGVFATGQVGNGTPSNSSKQVLWQRLDISIRI